MNISVITTILALLISCNKDVTPSPTNQESCDTIITQNHSYDTVLPSSYLMTYPGSWWEYSSSESGNNFTSTCDSWENVPVYSSSNSGDCIFNEDILILPEGPIYTFDFILGDKEVTTDTDNYSTQIIPILDTVVGGYYEEDGSGGENVQSYYTKRESFGFIDSMEVNNTLYHDVLHVKHYTDIIYTNGMNYIFYTNYYFVEFVGIIKMEGFKNGYFDVELVNYNIAPH